MQTLKDTEARISKITNDHGVVTVELEWGGPSDRGITDFDLDRLGKIAKGLGTPHGGNLRSGWVILDGECDLEEGDTIPVLDAMKTQHAPGPWKAQGSRIIQAGKMEAWQLIIASLPTTIDPRPTPDAAAKEYATRDANARLIAAAPELLATLERLLSIANNGAVMRHETGKPAWSFIDEVKTQARAAITKATTPNA